jgi:formate-dependent phosphoribosylglycinamide formyltransferase (GAR transformylase)
MTALYTITPFGNAQQCTADVEHVLGCFPIAFRQFAEDYAEVWQPPGAAEAA